MLYRFQFTADNINSQPFLPLPKLFPSKPLKPLTFIISLTTSLTKPHKATKRPTGGLKCIEY